MKKFIPMKKMQPKPADTTVSAPLVKAFEDLAEVPTGKVNYPLVAKAEQQATKAEAAIEASTPALKNALAEKADADYVKTVAPYAPHENLIQEIGRAHV